MRPFINMDDGKAHQLLPRRAASLPQVDHIARNLALLGWVSASPFRRVRETGSTGAP